MAIEQNILVTVDALVFTKGGKILLIKRKNDPFRGQWAFPGGFVEDDEDLADAAVRELEEETGLVLSASDMIQVGAYGKPGRDPRSRTLSVAFKITIEDELEVQGADDAAEAKWLLLSDLPQLAFDHSEILKDAL